MSWSTLVYPHWQLSSSRVYDFLVNKRVMLICVFWSICITQWLAWVTRPCTAGRPPVEYFSLLHLGYCLSSRFLLTGRMKQYWNSCQNSLSFLCVYGVVAFCFISTSITLTHYDEEVCTIADQLVPGSLSTPTRKPGYEATLEGAAGRPNSRPG